MIGADIALESARSVEQQAMRLIAQRVFFASPEQRAAGHACCRKNDIATHHISDCVDMIGVFDAHFGRALFFLAAVENKAALHLASDTSERGSSQDSFGSAANAHIDVDARTGRLGRVDDTGNVAVGDEIDRGTCLSDGFDELVMSRAIEDAHSDVFRCGAARLGERFDIVLGRAIERDRVVGVSRPDGDLIHIDVRRMEQTITRCQRGHRERIGHSFGGERCAFERIDGDINERGVFAVEADLLADEEHGGLVAFALADDDPPAHGHRVEASAHGGDGDFIGLIFVAAADLAVRGDGCGLRCMDDPQYKIRAELALIPHTSL